ncbi:sugar phosphate isomerase/epimerase family protein [Nonomuraea sp. NPDC003754]
MRLAVINDEVHQDLSVVARTARSCGFSGIEIRSLANTPPHRLGDEQLAQARRTVSEHGLEVAGFCPPAMKCDLPRTDEDVGRVRALLIRAVEQARLLGAPHVRAFTFYRDGAPDPVSAAQVAREVLHGVSMSGVQLLVETGTRTNTPTIALIMTFLDVLGHSDVGILWDPGNSVFSGRHRAPFPEEYRIGSALIRHVHVKDPAGTTGYVRLGEGDLPWAEIVAALAADGYEGWLSLETHWRHGRVLTREERDRPWGEAFTEGGHAASVECMRWLKRLVTT